MSFAQRACREREVGCCDAFEPMQYGAARTLTDGFLSRVSQVKVGSYFAPLAGTRRVTKFISVVSRRVARTASVTFFAIFAMTFAAACERSPLQWRTAATSVGEVLRYAIGDGRTTYVDTNSQIHVNVSGAETRIVVNRGGALIAGKGDRPLKVIVAGVAVWSTQAEFSVREHHQMAVDVLVSQGSIRVAGSASRFAEWLRDWRDATLVGGEAASADAGGVVDRRTLPPETIAHRQAWKDGWLWFTDETLGDAVARFNEYNADRKLVLDDPRLEHITVGGRFRSTEPDSFAATLKVIFGARIRIRPARQGMPTTIHVAANCSPRMLRCDTPLGQ